MEWHCRHCFFFYFKSTPHSGTLGHTGFGQENWAVEFRQCHCRNSKIFSRLLSLFSLLLFGWISAMPLPKFSLSPQFPNYLWTVRITQINFEFYNINPKDSIKGGFWMESLALGAEPWIFCLGAKTIKLKNIWCSNQNYITTIPINTSSKEIE